MGLDDKVFELIKIVLTDTTFGIGLRNRIAEYYLLPKIGFATSRIEMSDGRPGGVSRPSKEIIDIENDPKRKEEEEEMERIMGLKDEEDE